VENAKQLTKKEIVVIANSYAYLTDFIAYDPDVYKLSREKGCYEEAVKKIRFFCRWSEELVIEVAKYYSSMREFKEYDKEAYKSACRNGWLERVTEYMPRTAILAA